MNIIEKAVEKLEEELDELLRDDDDARPQRASAAALDPVPVKPARRSGDASDAVRPAARPAPAPSDIADEPAPPSEENAVRSDLVEVDLQRLTDAGFVTPLKEQTLLAEEFRLIKRPLLARAAASSADAQAPRSNLIIVTSSLPAEGKTFNAANLAMSIAMEVDRTVLLVDADVAKSDISSIFGVTGRKGLSNYLDGSERDLSKLLVRTNVESLSVLPSGPRHPRITELLASAQMRTLVAELADRYTDRIVIFDSPPLLATTGASVLAHLVGQVVMVVEAVRTPQSAVREALRRLGPLPNVGVVFNKQRSITHGRYGSSYGYGYGYGYGHGYDGDPAADQAPARG